MPNNLTDNKYSDKENLIGLRRSLVPGVKDVISKIKKPFETTPTDIKQIRKIKPLLGQTNLTGI